MTQFTPVDLMMQRVCRNGSESDVARFWELTYAGEFLTRITAATIVSCIDNSRDRDRYGLEHRLVRADGLGEWVQVMENALTGPPASHLNMDAHELKSELLARSEEGTWIFDAVMELQEVLSGAYDPNIKIKEKPSIRLWFNMFVQLRNKAKGHGAPSPAKLSGCVESMDKSIRLMVENLPINKFEWAYLHQNLSGKYRVIRLGTKSSSFDYLKKGQARERDNLSNGIYIWISGPRRINLLYSDQDCGDFLFPNGDFKADDFEVHSLITDDRRRESNKNYKTTPAAHPESETEGSSELIVIGNVHTNIPPKPQNYILRPRLENEIKVLIENDRHPVLTLVGRGGIGKTSLTLKLLHDIAYESRFELMVWFSSRDIDLIESGAKQVRPAVLTERDIANVFRDLVGASHKDLDGKKIDAIDFMANQLHRSDYGPILFIFDNFETLRSPHDVYSWIDANIRLPNKVIITSRFRDFKGDYPIDIPGMEDRESQELIEVTANNLGIKDRINKENKSIIIEESDGHPYVIKILIGEIADKGDFSRPSMLIARRDDVLNALFERTFSSLSPLAARIFMTLSRWRSAVPQLVMEATLLRHVEDDGIYPEAAVDQLVRTSLVERSSDSENIDHLTVPLSGSIFGRAKLEVSANRPLIMEDVNFLQYLGASDLKTDRYGFLPRLRRLFSAIAQRIEVGELGIAEVRPVLEFLARGYPKAWILLSDLESDGAQDGWQEQATEYLRRYLQSEPSGTEALTAWKKLESLYKDMGDAIAGCGAFVRAADISAPPLAQLTSMANWLNSSDKARQNLTTDERSAIFLPLAKLIEPHLDDASATDLSRLGWLYLNTGDAQRAKEVADLGLDRDATNAHCIRLIERLEAQGT
ncbi:MAG: NB-ARC domain-containing protein [Pseudoalteromonas distincta]